MAEPELQRMEAAAWDNVLSDRFDYQPTSVNALATKLRSVADSIGEGKGLNRSAKGYITAYVVASWVKSHMKGLDAGEGVSHTGTNSQGDTVAFEKRYTWFNVNDFLTCTSLAGACRHSAVLVRDLLTSTGSDLNMKAYYVSGWLKSFGLSKMTMKDGTNHAWSMVELDNGLRVPFDATGTSNAIEKWRSYASRYRPSPAPTLVIPRTREQMELFLACHFGNTLDTGYGKTDSKGIARRMPGRNAMNSELFMKMPRDEWLAVDTSYLKDLQSWVYKQNRVR